MKTISQRKVYFPINESNINRLIQHNDDSDCGIISGYRFDNTKAENQQINRKLKSELVSMGYSVLWVRGFYDENYGKKPEEIPEKTAHNKKKEDGREDSWFVWDPNNQHDLLDDLISLGRKYNQDSILFIPKLSLFQHESMSPMEKQKKQKPFLYGLKNTQFIMNNEKKYFSGTQFGKKAEFMTIVGNKPMVFVLEECICDAPETLGGLYFLKAIGGDFIDPSLENIY